MHLSTDVLVIGAGGAGMYAALAAARSGANVLLTDRNLIGRAGATVMAQMTVAAALAEEEPDAAEFHLADTVAAGRGLCDANLAEVLCEQAPLRMREMDEWGVGWARGPHGIRQVHAPGHDRQRCCYVDFLNTGPAVAGTLRKRVGRARTVRRISELMVTDLVINDEAICGAVGVSLHDGQAVTIEAPAVVIATGGLTRLYSRTSASNNMVGDGYALALRAGAALQDMEFVQFFPIGHLAPRLVGMDPIMWDPFRYKLGGRLLNGEREEFIDRYGAEDDGKYRATRDLATYAILREVAEGRGTPAGGAYLSFEHVPEQELRAAFGPVVDRLLENGIDLSQAPVEVSPIAHYHMGGIRVTTDMHTALPGLYAAGEAIGGAAGANRLSGNAISEALVFGDIAGCQAATLRGAPGNWSSAAARRVIDAQCVGCAPLPARDVLALRRELGDRMWRQVGPFRSAEGLAEALMFIRAARRTVQDSCPPCADLFANTLQDWHDLRNALLVSETIAVAAMAREESRGSHQRDDFPDTDNAFLGHLDVRLGSSDCQLEFRPR